MKLKAIILGLALAGTLSGALAQQAPLAGTLQKVAGQKAIYLGYREAAEPFTYVDEQGQVKGYSWDLCMKVVDAIKQRVGQPDLQLVPVPVTASTRTLSLVTGVVDLDCSAAPNTLIAQKYVAFGMATYVASLKVLVRKDGPVAVLQDLGGKSVISPAGIEAERYLKSNSALRGVGMTYMQGRDRSDAFQRFEAGQADALVADEAGMAVLLARSADRGKYRVLDQSLAFEPLSIAMRLGDVGLKQLADEVLVGVMRSGEINRIYDQWFTAPIMPSGINLELPMDPLLKGMLQNPSDQGV